VPISAEQLAANRANAARSTGPRTPEGKARSAPFVPMTPDMAGNGDIEITRAQNRNYALADGFHRMVRQANSWSLFLRYQAQAERHYRRAVEEFDRLKALLGELPNEPILEVQPEETETTCAPPDEPISEGQADQPALSGLSKPHRCAHSNSSPRRVVSERCRRTKRTLPAPLDRLYPPVQQNRDMRLSNRAGVILR
jgi:hypothetical protein